MIDRVNSAVRLFTPDYKIGVNWSPQSTHLIEIYTTYFLSDVLTRAFKKKPQRCIKSLKNFYCVGIVAPVGY